MTFFGMVSTGFISGFMLDTLGRKKILWVGFLLETAFTLGSCFSISVSMLSVFKFLGGTMTGGLYVALTAYILEFHATEYRGKVQMIYGMTFSIANCIMPLVSSVILPLNFDYSLGFMNFRPWNLLMLISTVNPLISFIVFYFLPETPKFLMSIGKNEEALDVLRYVYKLNTRDLKENYPITSLIEEVNLEEAAANKKSWKEYFYMGWQQVTPLFSKQYRFKVLLVCLIHGLFLMGINSLRLYLPQIFQASHDYEVTHNGETPDLCNILEVTENFSRSNDEDTCSVNLENSFNVYLNSTLVSLVTILGYAMAGTLINLFGSKRLLVILCGSGCLTGIGLIWSTNTATTLTLSSLYLTALGVGFDIFMIMLVVIFPTTLRAMAISFALFFGRFLTIFGNMLMPALVNEGCAPPFLFLAGVAAVTVISSLLIKTTGKEDMK
ncbi:solute carrier family 22 member 15-like isoform X2 [Euwallacea fornicatus]